MTGSSEWILSWDDEAEKEHYEWLEKATTRQKEFVYEGYTIFNKIYPSPDKYPRESDDENRDPNIQRSDGKQVGYFCYNFVGEIRFAAAIYHGQVRFILVGYCQSEDLDEIIRQRIERWNI